MVYDVFIPLDLYCFQKREGLKSPLLSMILMKDKYLLHTFNEIISIVGLLSKNTGLINHQTQVL